MRPIFEGLKAYFLSKKPKQKPACRVCLGRRQTRRLIFCWVYACSPLSMRDLKSMPRQTANGRQRHVCLSA